MIKAILAILAGLVKAIPSLWQWKQHSEKKKAKKTLGKDLQKIDDDVRNGHADAVAKHIKRLLK